MRSFTLVAALFCAVLAVTLAYPFPDEGEGEVMDGRDGAEGEDENEELTELESLFNGEVDDNELTDYFEALASGKGSGKKSGGGGKNGKKGKKGTGRPRRKTTKAPST